MSITSRAKVLIPIKTVSALNVREHWSARARRAKKERSAAFLMCPKFKLPAIVTLTRIGPKTLDSDAVPGSQKGIRDGIADRIGIDDADPRIEWRYAQRIGEYGVEVEVSPQTKTGDQV